MRKTLLSVAVFAGAVTLAGTAHARPATAAAVVNSASHTQAVQYYEPNHEPGWREREEWRRHREAEWRRRQAYREHEEWREHHLGGPPAVVVTPPPVVYGRGW